MLRATTSKVLRQGILSGRRGASLTAPRLQEFHASYRRDEEAKETPAVPEPKESWYHPMYGLGGGIALAVPIIHYEWYVINEETQLFACFLCFLGLVHKQFGTVIHDALLEDGKAILAETNAAEDRAIVSLEESIKEIEMQDGIVSDIEAVKQLKIDTYAKMNETGKVKPLYNFKSQVEKLLTVIAAEEAASQDKEKMALMEEATASVAEQFASSKDLQKKALANSISMLKGAKTGSDPVKEAYLSFFADKKKAAAQVDEATEAKASRAALIAKLNAVAKNDKFYFEFDASGKPVMSA